jgi:NADH dehydrogenase
MNVLVAGGSGFVGKNLCRELEARGHSVTALSRSPGNDDLPDGISKAMGDVSAYDSIAGHFAGADAVVNLVALSPLFEPPGGNRMHDVVHRQGTENVVRAAEEHGVDRLVQMSGLGADPDAPTAYLRAKGRAEAHVRDSDLTYTVFRPSVVFGDGAEFLSFTKLFAPPYVTPLPNGGGTPFQPIWVGDLGPMMADAIESDDHAGETYELGGPEVLTLAEVARKIHGAAGRPVNVIPLPMSLARLGLTVLDVVPGAPMGMDQYRSLTLDHTPAHNDVEAFGVAEDDLKSLGTYLTGGRAGHKAPVRA